VREAETFGGPRPVPAAIAQDLRDGLALNCAEIGGDRTRRPAPRDHTADAHGYHAMASAAVAVERLEKKIADPIRPSRVP
jgi:hypothetical protein